MGIIIQNIEDIRSIQPFPQPLVTAEEKGPVADDGAAQRAAELVSLEFRLSAAKGIIFPPGCVKVVVAQSPKSRAVHRIGPRFGDRADNRPGLASVFGRIVVGDNLELLDGFRPEVSPGGSLRIAGKIVVGNPVQKKVILLPPGPTHTHLLAHATHGTLIVALWDAEHARLQKRQLHHVPAGERQVLDLLLFHHLGNRGAGCLHESGLPGDGDGLRHLAHLQDVVHHRSPPYYHRNSRPDAGLKPGERGADFVIAGWQARSLVSACGAGF